MNLENIRIRLELKTHFLHVRKPIMRKVFLSTILGMSLIANSGSAKTISDSLVENLSCDQLSVNKIYEKIRPTAFSSDHHMPVENWSFRSNGFNLAACWGMASTQRKLFYLLRLGVQDAPPLDLLSAMDLVRGTTVSFNFSSNDEAQANARIVYEKTLKQYHVIPLAEKNITKEWERKTGQSFMEKLLKGAHFTFDQDSLYRSLRSEVERSQELHFFRPSNIEMGIGNGPRTVKENRETLAAILHNISTNRLTLLNLRLKMKVQHIVIPKTFTKDERGNVWIYAYDSNSPSKDQLIYFDIKNGHFYSPQILGFLVDHIATTDYTQPLGAFIVDEEERGYIEKTLLKYYNTVCDSQKNEEPTP